MEHKKIFEVPTLSCDVEEIGGALLQTKKKKKNGFTLIEIGVVILIMALLTTAAIVGMESYIGNANVSALKQNILSLVSAAHSYGGINAGNQYGAYYNMCGSGTTCATANIAGAVKNVPYLPTPYPIPNAFGGYGSITYVGNYVTVTETGSFSYAQAQSICGPTTSLYAHLYVGVTPTCTGGTISLSFQ